MAKKSGKSKSLVLSGGRKLPVEKGSMSLTVAAATDTSLAEVLPSPQAHAKLIGSGGEIKREEGVILVTGRGYATNAGVIPAEEVYYDATERQKADGPWLGEADKIAWRDEASGYDCILLRSRHGGYLSGYVGVPRDHPLWGWDHQAVPMELGIVVHGGLDYSKPCEDSLWSGYRLAREARRICHVPRAPRRKEQPVNPAGDAPEDPDAWWFGFSCNHAYDMGPNDSGRASGFMQAEVGPQYRDDGYVIFETVTLASQLRAIANGDRAPERSSSLPPPLGLDPAAGGRK